MLINIKPWVLKNGKKLFSQTKRNSILTVRIVFRSTGTPKIFQKKITQQGIVEEDLLWSRRGDFWSSGKLKLQVVGGWQKAADYIKMLNNLSLTQEGSRLCGEGWIFQQDNAAIHNASITKKYLLEQNIRLLDHSQHALQTSIL